jgi:hypothetical protein
MSLNIRSGSVVNILALVVQQVKKKTNKTILFFFLNTKTLAALRPLESDTMIKMILHCQWEQILK